MTSRFSCTLAMLVTLGLGLSAVAQPPEGSRLPDEENGCAICHGEEILWTGEQQRLYVARGSMVEDVHARSGVNCHDCHGGDPATLDVAAAHAREVPAEAAVLPFRPTPDGARAACGSCHDQVALLLRKSVHARAERDREDAPGKVLLCNRCHGEKAHGMLPVADNRSPVQLDRQVETCGGCHEEDRESYRRTVHGAGLFESGLVMAAVCADCHGSHGIYYAADERSTLHLANVARTCGKCHQGIEDLVEQSVHGGEKSFPVRSGDSSRKSWQRSPSCTDCHQGHRLLHAATDAYRSQVTNYCGNCHPELTARYAMSTHGELTELGHVAAAKCPDCHGAHEILRVDDPQGMLALGDNRLATCQKCHTHAVMNFSRFDPHADHKDAVRYPTLYRVYSSVHTVFYAFMAFFVIHAFLWFVRSFVTVLRHGRHRTLVAGRYVIERSTVADRTIYVMLLVSVLGLLATGLPLKHSSQHWAYVYVQALGGFEYTSILHHVCATVALACCAAHAICVLRYVGRRRRQGQSWIAIAFGPDSPAPTPRDARDMFGMLKWFCGLGPKPTFERWTYWEKYDYWMAGVACLLVGTSGLIMWFPHIFCSFFSGQALNLVRVIHVELSVLAASFLLVFHFYHTHFRPEKFPLDLSAVTGLVNEGHLREQRPAYVARLEEMNLLSSMRRPAPTRRRLWQLYVGTCVVLLIGLGLLSVALTAAIGE